jgi:hypothetical protein
MVAIVCALVGGRGTLLRYNYRIIGPA